MFNLPQIIDTCTNVVFESQKKIEIDPLDNPAQESIVLDRVGLVQW